MLTEGKRRPMGKRAPPADLFDTTMLERPESEKAVLAALLLAIQHHPRGVAEVAAVLTPQMFADPLQGEIMAAIHVALASDRPGIAEVSTAIRRQAEAAGNDHRDVISMVADLLQMFIGPDPVRLATLAAQEVREAHAQREAIRTLQDGVQDIRTGGLSEVGRLAERLAGIREAVSNDRSASGAVRLTDCIREWLEREEPEAILTGLPPFDRATGGGLPLGAVTLFAAPPGVGKTAIALQLALGAMAADPSLRVVWGLGEMTRRAFARRVAAVGADILSLAPLTLGDAKAKTDHAYRVTSEVEKRFADRLIIVDGAVSVERVALAVKESGARIAVFDYLQRLHSVNEQSDRVLELERIASQVLELAVTQDVACVLLSATAKASDKDARVDQMVRGSGSPGFDAEFAYYGDAPTPEDRGATYPVVWRCRKARSEAMVDVELQFDGPTQTYSDPQINADLAAFAPRGTTQ
jgi:replicative DNA helicase